MAIAYLLPASVERNRSRFGGRVGQGDHIG